MPLTFSAFRILAVPCLVLWITLLPPSSLASSDTRTVSQKYHEFRATYDRCDPLAIGGPYVSPAAQYTSSDGIAFFFIADIEICPSSPFGYVQHYIQNAHSVNGLIFSWPAAGLFMPSNAYFLSPGQHIGIRNWYEDRDTILSHVVRDTDANIFFGPSKRHAIRATAFTQRADMDSPLSSEYSRIGGTLTAQLTDSLEQLISIKVTLSSVFSNWKIHYEISASPPTLRLAIGEPSDKTSAMLLEESLKTTHTVPNYLSLKDLISKTENTSFFRFFEGRRFLLLSSLEKDGKASLGSMAFAMDSKIYRREGLPVVILTERMEPIVVMTVPLLISSH